MKADKLALGSVLIALAGFSLGVKSAPAVVVPAAAPAAPAVAAAPDEPAQPAAPAQPKAAPAPKKAAAAPAVKRPQVDPGMAPPENSLLKEAPFLGNRDAPVAVLVVSDFQCPVCRRAAEPMDEISAELGSDAVIYFVQNPLDMHPRALDAALASAAAHRQGKFWEYHDLLFKDQRRLSPGDLERHAETLSLDMEKWNRDRNDPELRTWIDQQKGAAAKLGARGTPAFFINGKKQVGWGSKMGLVGQIKRELKDAKASLGGKKDGKAIYPERVKANSDDADFFLAAFGR